MDTVDGLIQRLIVNAKKIQRGKYRDLDELFHFTKSHLYPPNIANLAEAFGLMAVKLEAREYKLSETIKTLHSTTEELRKSKSALEEYARTLEQKVEERTAEISKIAATDELTGLFNRREILRIIRHVLSRRDVRDLALVFFDIDHFKAFNDTFGHQVGDEVLRIVGKVVRESLRESDLAGRYGGEEFLVVLPKSAVPEARLVTERIQKAFAASTAFPEGGNSRITASFGIVALGDNKDYLCSALEISSLECIFGAKARNESRIHDLRSRLLDLLLKMSDQALYKAKKTLCLKCGFESEKAGLFGKDTCPQCSGSELEKGRNRIKTFSAGVYF